MSLGYKKHTKANVREYFRRTMKQSFTLSDEARAVLRGSHVTAETVTLPAQLDRKLYVEINKALVGIGGKWDRHRSCHVFLCDPRERLKASLETGKAINGAWMEHEIYVMKQAGQKLDGDNLQDVLDSGTNAARTGRQQFLTPPEFATALMIPLPPALRKPGSHFVDLTMGAGSLLTASGAENLLGLDIDSRLARKPSSQLPATSSANWHCVNADLTKFYPLLQEIDWQFDLCGLNPPFSVKWHRENLAALAESECKAVKVTFGPARAGTIESTLATMLIALDRMSSRGEGFMICSETVAAKIDDLPIGQHVWLWLHLPQSRLFKDTSPLNLSVLYFARSHTNGPELTLSASANADAREISQRLTENIGTQRALYRKGLSIFTHDDFEHSAPNLWETAATEWRRINSNRKSGSDFNIWLRTDGKIGRHLTPFQNWSARIPREKVEALNKLQGQTPMSLVVQRATRSQLLEAIGPKSIWRVDPQLIAAVQTAIAGYHSQRAPFYPLNEVQRLGYLDEEDTIVCKRAGIPGFKTGESYKLSSETVDVERPDERLNLVGEIEEVTYLGKELAFYIADSNGKQHKFSPVAPEHESQKPVKDGRLQIVAEFTHDVEALIRHFHIPEVADVAQIQPERYQLFVDRIRQIEAQVNKAA